MATTRSKPVAVVTGASSGIGAATAIALANRGYRVVAGARRIDRLRKVVGESGVALPLDVTDRDSVDSFVSEIAKRFRHIDVLVNNAGGAVGLTSVAESKDDEWITMWKTNVLGLMRVTQALLPALRASGDGLVVNIGSTAGRWSYETGGGYTAAKHATRVVTETLRLELNGEPKTSAATAFSRLSA